MGICLCSSSSSNLTPVSKQTLQTKGIVLCPWIVQLYLQPTAAYDRSFMKQSGHLILFLYVIQYDVASRHYKLWTLRLTTTHWGSSVLL